MAKIHVDAVRHYPSDLDKRALAAYYRAGGLDEPSHPILEYELPGGKRYVVLGNMHGILAVYRYRLDTDRIYRIYHWPDVIDRLCGAEAA